ncbi:MAG: formylglycine-generating enzyme family protein [Candidatus Hydrogenedentes bacterium]|nr:formylglycine-generating enzyme family protein [Candidatus Hydrogenedentota bacterium]
MRVISFVFPVLALGLASVFTVAGAGELPKQPASAEPVAVSSGGAPAAGEQRTFAGIEFCWVPAGTFMMGSPASEQDRQPNEVQHEVTITKGFWIGKYEVTQAQWEAAMGNNPAKFVNAASPVEQVSHDDCQRFVETLNQRGEGTFRLPTEAEWEYACRAGTKSAYSFGDDKSVFDQYARARHEVVKKPEPETKDAKQPQVAAEEAEEEEDKERGTLPVGSLKQNPWGLHDMHGNVAEWCSDWFGEYPAGPATDPEGAESGHLRITRGGHWDYSPAFIRSAYRNYNLPDRSYGNLGLRLVRVAD